MNTKYQNGYTIFLGQTYYIIKEIWIEFGFTIINLKSNLPKGFYYLGYS